MTTKISVVIPVFNEAEAITTLINKLGNVLSKNYPSDFEVLFVDDGSTDNTTEVLEKEKIGSSWLKIITLTRNYGQSTALQAGFDFSIGEFIVTMDGDLQNEPDDIPKLLDLIEKNHDHVSYIHVFLIIRRNGIYC